MVISLRVLLPAITPVLLSACTEGDGAVRDSPGKADLPLWQAAEAPALVIGVVEGAAAYQFDGIAAVRRLPDGTFLVADRGAREVRMFDTDGRHLRTVGRAGGGPGEFESVSRLFVLPGDEFGIWDARQKRYTVFSRNGPVERVETIDLPGMGGPLEAVFDDGSMVARPGIDGVALFAASEGERRLPLMHLLRAPGEAEWRPLEGFAGREEFVTRANGVSTTAILFGRDHVAAAGRSRWYTGDTDRFEVTVRAPDGSELLVLRREHTPQPVTDAILARAHADQRERAERNRQETARVMGSRAASSVVPPHRSTMPAFDEVVEDSDENVWVRHYRFPADAPQRWSVFAQTGELIAEAETPAGLRVQQIGPDWITGIATDDFGVAYVHVHLLSRT
jgi:hypothetical protein